MTDIVRTAINDLAVQELVAREAAVDVVTNYFNRQTDITQVKASIKVRYGYGIKSVQDPNNSTAVLETYVKENFHEAVDAGLIDAITIGYGQKITNALATLFTESGLRFGLVHPNDTKDNRVDVTAAEVLLKDNRDKGSFLSVMTSADQKSVQVGSSAVLIAPVRGSLCYQVLSPADVRAFFSDTISEEGRIRATDKTDIEDASVITIRLSNVNLDTWNYLAIFGQSDEYPMGRYVEYQASNIAAEIPAFNSEGTVEYFVETDGGVIYCNPLTYWANMNPDLDLPEYPIAVLDGGVTEANEYMPITESLYDNCLKFDEKASHLLSTSQDDARGTMVFSRTETGAGKPLPRTATGAIVTEPGIDTERVDHDSQASVDAWTVLEKEMIQCAGGFGIPAYYIVEEDSQFAQASSGIALQVKTEQLKKARQKRIAKNRPSVRKIFTVEQALISLFSEADETDIVLLNETEQRWDAGEIKLPQNKTEVVQYIDTLMNNGIMDTIAGIKEFYQLATDQEAIEVYEKMKDRATDFPSLVEPEKPKVGLQTRGNGQNIRAVR
jgi:hypothetical protein